MIKSWRFKRGLHKIRPDVKAACALLLHAPEDWQARLHAVRHKSGVAIWVGNGFNRLHFHPDGHELNWWEKVVLDYALRCWRGLCMGAHLPIEGAAFVRMVTKDFPLQEKLERKLKIV